MHSSDHVITAHSFDILMQDTWLPALAIRNGQPPVADDALYRHCFDMIRQVQDKLTAAGASDDLCEEIKFAHCVFPYEALMTQPDKDVSVWWWRTPLQGHFPGHLNGGEHFFQHIHKLWRDPAPSELQVACYFRMLSFGYAGKYRTENDGERLSIMQQLKTLLPKIPCRESHHAIFLNDSIISLTEKIFETHLIDKLSVALKLSTRYPQHDFMMQYEEPDYAHIARRLADAGVALYRQYDEESNEDTIILTDSSHGRLKEPAIPYRHPSGLFDGERESVRDMQVVRSAAPNNYRNSQSDMKAEVTICEEYRALRATDHRRAKHHPDAGKAYAEHPGQGFWYAGIRREGYLCHLVMFEEKSNCMRLRPGTNITRPGQEWPGTSMRRGVTDANGESQMLTMHEPEHSALELIKGME